MTPLFIIIHIVGLAGLALYGLLGFLTLGLYIRHRRAAPPQPPVPDEWPTVTVQLPVYNERAVVQRLIAAAVALDYPRDRLEIQVLDDSTDETTALAAACVAEYQARGVSIRLLYRCHRRGFKAGALKEGLSLASGAFIAIFDADFAPRPDFLRRVVPYLAADPGLGAVQTRWGHLNAADSGLTQAQAIALDKHFAVEQLVRFRANFFPKFNGSAGVWRRACIEAAGGWQADTLCEDLCLSTRAVLGGWRFHYADDVVAPAELPASILAYKTQQARWATGATQCLVKYVRPISRAADQSLLARLYALLSMAAYSTHLMFLMLLLAQLPLILAGYRLPAWMALFSLFGLGQPLLFALAQQSLYPDWPTRLRHLPTLLLIAIGLAPTGAWAILSAFSSRRHSFTRTPKGSRRAYRLAAGPMLVVEFALMLYSATSLILALRSGFSGPVFLLATCVLGFGYIAGLSLWEALDHT
jgi:cellulose synthase/poly-beta-1,6-N-acetylglucosamine synthase-like glycosyltransferase